MWFLSWMLPDSLCIAPAPIGPEPGLHCWSRHHMRCSPDLTTEGFPCNMDLGVGATGTGSSTWGEGKGVWDSWACWADPGRRPALHHSFDQWGQISLTYLGYRHPSKILFLQTQLEVRIYIKMLMQLPCRISHTQGLPLLFPRVFPLLIDHGLAIGCKFPIPWFLLGVCLSIPIIS